MREIYTLRYAVYVEEQGKVYPWLKHEQRQLIDEADAGAYHQFFVRGPDGSVIAAVRAHIHPNDEVQRNLRWDLFDEWKDVPLYYISRFVVHPEFRRSKATAVLMTALYRDWLELGSPFGFLNCAERYVPLYRRLGFTAYAQPYEDAHAGRQVPMLLPAGDSWWNARHASVYHQAGQRPAPSKAEEWFNEQRAPGGRLHFEPIA